MSRDLGPEFDAFFRENLPGLGLDWRRHRRRCSRRRVLDRVRALGLRSLSDYASVVEHDSLEKSRLVSLVRVPISRFYREAQVWEYLGKHVLPGFRGQNSVIMFSAGCANGEEPYSLAMLWSEKGPPAVAPHILAMDIGLDGLSRARLGFYPISSLREIPSVCKEKYFIRRPHGFQIKDEIKGMVDFYQADLLAMGTPGALDLALCRNLAYTYFGKEEQRKVSSYFQQSMKPGGCLVVGAKEEPVLEGFEVIYPCIYKRTA